MHVNPNERHCPSCGVRFCSANGLSVNHELSVYKCLSCDNDVPPQVALTAEQHRVTTTPKSKAMDLLTHLDGYTPYDDDVPVPRFTPRPPRKSRGNIVPNVDDTAKLSGSQLRILAKRSEQGRKNRGKGGKPSTLGLTEPMKRFGFKGQDGV
ncbi:hypothetical protein G7K_4907-t1 [Saitoella complicata NRRL Y-17804]|uniref:Uncharacterized protein n=1 Tax=Saitoella complicata (strain BCRC 22490 / CBS 7301 / JCM 7358 / NBRC 10748 / NRRL Y-17804) TaxID=698492 RepID=A0A0E9NM57_SAICN|nr:hypothetical protein G7K_4907-t1 [Saitoella complicata NRRL Y-17804]